MQPVSAQQTFTIEGTVLGSQDDANPGDGVCANTDGECTFRAAFQEANADPDTDTIEFANMWNDNTPYKDWNWVFYSESLVITEPVVFDGTTAPDYQAGVRLGASIYNNATDPDVPGVIIESGAAGSVIRGLAVSGASGDGFVVRADDVELYDCYAGIDDNADSSADPNNGVGIRVEAGQNVIIGEYGFIGRPNVVSNNDGDGIVVEGGSDVSVGGNIVGLLPDGSTALANGGSGIRVTGGSSHQIGTRFVSTIGTLYDGNTVSAHSGNAGIIIDSDGHELYANVVGLTADESAIRGNRTGIEIFGDNNTVGSTSRGGGSNVVAGNDGNGIILGAGVDVNDNLVQNNYVGVARTTSLLAGNNVGISVTQGQDNTLEGNVVGANAGGIAIDNAVYRTILENNYVGTNPDGDNLGNRKDGIIVESDVSTQTSTATRISQGNVIAFTVNGPGVVFRGQYNSIGGSYIGTDADGNDLGNGGPGIQLIGESDAIIGDASSPNTIGFNDGPGIEIIDGSRNTVQGNYIGTDASDRVLGNAGDGIRVEATSGNSANENLIGYDYGETIPAEAYPAGGNTIANNTGNGITVFGAGTPLRVTMRGNTTLGNGGRSIDLGDDGIDGTDGGDADGGTNNTMNAPEIDQSSTYNTSTGDVDVTFAVDCSVSNCDYGTDGLDVDFYATTQTDEVGRYIGTVSYPSSAAGTQMTATFTPPASANVQQSDYIVGVATTARGNSSETPEEVFQLPVELSDLAARATGEAVVLTWKTLSETGNDRFEIQQKAPGAPTFRQIGTVEGAGTTTESTDYRFATDELSAGVHTFRLRQVDVDGDAHVSRTVTARIELTEAIALSAPFPNPVRDQLSVRVGVQESQTVRVVLYDVLGRAVATLHSGSLPGGEERTLRATLSTLPSGKYFLRLEGESGQVTRPLTVLR